MTRDGETSRSLVATFDAYAQEFAGDAEARAQSGAAVAAADISWLIILAEFVARAVEEWAGIVAEIELGRRTCLDLSRAAHLVLESVFDEVLEPSAWLVLEAAIDLPE